MIWFVLVRNWMASWSCVRAKSWTDGSLSELSFSCQAIKDTHACFLYGEMKCLSHPSFSHIILLKEHNNICFYIYTLVVLKSIGLCSYVDILFLRDLSVKLKLYRTQSVNHFAEERLNKVYYCSIALRFKISFSVFSLSWTGQKWSRATCTQSLPRFSHWTTTLRRCRSCDLKSTTSMALTASGPAMMTFWVGWSAPSDR